MTKLTNTFMITVFLLCFSSCQKDLTSATDITDFDWELKYVKKDGSKEKPDSDYILTFQNDTLFFLDFSVNTAGGIYQINETGHINIEDYHAFTEKCCDNEYDKLLQSSILTVSSYRVIGDNLIMAGEAEIKFKKQ